MSTLPLPNGLLRAHEKSHHLFQTQVSPRGRRQSTSTATSPPPSNPLLDLPLEIKQTILASLPDIVSLKSFMMTCWSLYHAFRGCEPLILAKIVHNQINPSLMHNAIATFKSSQITTWDTATVDELVMLYTTCESTSQPPKWILRNASVLIETHSHIRFFAEEFAKHALKHNPVTDLPQMDHVSASPSELLRIERTLYRFQFLCNLFNQRERCDGDRFKLFAANEPGRYHFRGFALWENEQLVCILEYLTDFVFNAFAQLPDMDYYSLTLRAWYGEDLGDKNPHRYISHGLAFLHQLALTEENEKCNLIFRHCASGPYDFFDEGPRAIDYLRLSRLWGMIEEQEWVLPQIAQDEDSGPEDTWRWAQACYEPAGRYRHGSSLKKYKYLRVWGYVMWDSARLVGWGVLQGDWNTLPRTKERERALLWPKSY